MLPSDVLGFTTDFGGDVANKDEDYVTHGLELGFGVDSGKIHGEYISGRPSTALGFDP